MLAEKIEAKKRGLECYFHMFRASTCVCLLDLFR